MLGHLDPKHGDEATVTMILLEADNLQSINDRWGHTTGNHVVQRLAAVISHRVEEYGWVARWGGEEFVAVIRESGEDSLAERLIEGMLEDLERTPLWVPGGEIRLRLGTGVARHTPGDDMQGMFNRADGKLYRANGLGPVLDTVPQVGPMPSTKRFPEATRRTCHTRSNDTACDSSGIFQQCDTG